MTPDDRSGYAFRKQAPLPNLPLFQLLTALRNPPA